MYFLSQDDWYLKTGAAGYVWPVRGRLIIPYFTLTLTKTGAGDGTVNSSPSGINCGMTCSESFDTGTMVTLTAIPDATSAVAGWSGACSGTGACTVTMDAAKSVTATFDMLNTYYQDADGDTYGNPSVTTLASSQPSGYVTNSSDCNDNNASINPGVAEVCNGVDDNCNSQTDEGVQNTYYRDADADTYGNASVTTQACTQPAGYVTNSLDCNDGNASINPDAAEVCNGVDDNCNGQIDEGVLNTYYRDADNDTYGDALVSTQACTQPLGYVSNSSDCNDGNALVNPGAAEVCNLVDDNCSGQIDEGVLNTYYQDADNDTYGNPSVSIDTCSAPIAYVLDNTDCNDANVSIHPGATEVCNSEDDNCNGYIDEGVQDTFYLDFDFDTYGNASVITQACSQPPGYVSDNTDCDDINTAINPGATEICNGINDNCNGQIDEGSNTPCQYANKEWVARYNGPGNAYDGTENIEVDNNGNLYVTGQSPGIGTGLDYSTVKYDSYGNQLWIARYNGLGNGDDFVYDLEIDSLGNVYVTGWSLSSDNNYDYATIKYDSDGNQLWVARYNGPDNAFDRPLALTVDVNGNVYVTGESLDYASSYDYATIKYDTNGNQLWVTRYMSIGFISDTANDIAVDSDGSVYVTGYSNNVETGSDFTTVKYDANGNQLWLYQYNGPGNSTDVAENIAVDGSGNVYVLGMSVGFDTLHDYSIIKYNASGNQMWVARYNGLGNSTDWPYAFALDEFGNVYVTGYSTGFGTGSDYATVKYSNDGNEIWVAHYNGSNNEGARALTIDNYGNVYVTGTTDDLYTGDDYVTIKYNNNGSQVWIARYSSPGHSQDGGNAITIDHNGNVYVTGNSVDPVTYGDFTTVKYSQDNDGDGWYSDGDCNDGNASINPGAAEVCNEIDDNCNGQTDEGVQNTYYQDADNDTYGNSSVTTQSCTQPTGYVTNNTDCNDSSASINPGAAEVCNGVDDNCNGQTDEGVQNTYYRDADNDTYGNVSVTTQACTQPSGYVSNSSDCNDGNASVYPGATEVCNGIDDNCNGCSPYKNVDFE